MVRLVAGTRPFSITNLGKLDERHLELRRDHFRVVSFFGLASAPVEASVLTVFTIAGRMHLHLVALEDGPDQTTLADDGERAVQRLIAALDA
jgi:hypothetical protein